MSKVYIALQDNDESRYIVEAIEESNPDATVIHQPAMIRIERENKLVIERSVVEEKMGRDWDVQASAAFRLKARHSVQGVDP